MATTTPSACGHADCVRTRNPTWTFCTAVADGDPCHGRVRHGEDKCHFHASGKMRVCDAAVLVLKETGNEAVMHGDMGLLARIAKRAGMSPKDHVLKTEKAVIEALTKCPGVLIDGFTLNARGRRVRIFRLPESQA